MHHKFMKALQKGDCQIAFMADIDHPDGMAYAWAGIGNIEYEGNTYLGRGLMASVTVAPKTSEIRVDEVIFYLSGIDQSLLNDLTYEVRDRLAVTYLAAIDRWKNVIERIVVDKVSLDYLVDNVDENGNAVLELHGDAGFWSLTNPTRRAWSPTDQKLRFPDDTGCDYVPQMENKETKWTPS